MIEVKFKKLHPDAKIPTQVGSGNVGFDLTAVVIHEGYHQVRYETGIAIEIPEGYFGLLFPRSSVIKQDLSLANSIGCVDSGFRGDLTLVFNKVHEYKKVYEVGDRIGQLIILPYPKVKMVEVEELSDTERGTKGFGSTGR